ncbi:Rv2175c family DNA-binding protein [Williamsia sp. MIQD14]|uniref:Rv2175c family DNA-binding protein n=1 Tax=Williamsia sp. MIQD14 TaxID=3425703 RepID=UPI003DA0F573
MASLPMTVVDLPDGEPLYDISGAARRLGLSAGKIRTMVAEHELLAVNVDGQPMIPEVFFDDDGIAKHLTGLIAVLYDGGFDRDGVMRWLFTVHDDLGEYPARALHGHSAREMIRRAQALGF